MLLQLCKSKIHKAVVTEAHIDYEGSITLDRELMEAAGIHPYEKVLVANFVSGARFETYAIEGKAGSKVVCLNGAAARLAQVGDTITVMAFAYCTAEEAKGFIHTNILLNKSNEIINVSPALSY